MADRRFCIRAELHDDHARRGTLNDGDIDTNRTASPHLDYFALNAAGTGPDRASNSRGLLVLNHENITQACLHPAVPTTTGGVRPKAEALKAMEAHGVSVIEVTRSATAWSCVRHPASTGASLR